MDTIKNGVIYYEKNNCNPFVRSVIRSVMILEQMHIDFVNGNRTIGIWGSEEVELAVLIERIALSNRLEELFEDAIALEGLQSLVKDRDSVKEVIVSILNYLYPVSGNSHTEENEYVKLWKSIYGKKEEFILRKSSGVNTVNFSETATYLKLFEKQKSLVKQMEHATATLLDTIPCEVNNIADIGSGPGLVNQFIPYFYDLLAIDINEEILNQNSRPTCIGDILDLPLADQSVDMTISCDVLEHIETEKVDVAVSELQRVSRKYIYIQVPYNEILRYGVAKCAQCGNIWHVNFHKDFFDLSKLKEFQTNGWKICQINFTGQVCNETENSLLYRKIQRKDYDIYRVEGFECPVCGTPSRRVNYDLFQEMDRSEKIDARSRGIVPRYTEIGVLFQRNQCKVRNNKLSEEIKSDQLYSNSCIDFTQFFAVKDTYTGNEQIPFVIMSERQVKRTEKGVCIEKLVPLVFTVPYNIADVEMTIEGFSEEETDQVKIVGTNCEQKEFIEHTELLEKGSFICRHQFGLDWKQYDSLVKIYVDKEVTISTIKFQTNEERKYYLIRQQDVENNHFRLEKDGMEYRYYIPENGVAFEKEGSYAGYEDKNMIELEQMIENSVSDKAFRMFFCSRIDMASKSDMYVASVKRKIKKCLDRIARFINKRIAKLYKLLCYLKIEKIIKKFTGEW